MPVGFARVSACLLPGMSCFSCVCRTHIGSSAARVWLRGDPSADMHPACPNKEQNHLQNSLLRRTQFWVRKTFSKPASLKKASLVVRTITLTTSLLRRHGSCKFEIDDIGNAYKNPIFLPRGKTKLTPCNLLWAA